MKTLLFFVIYLGNLVVAPLGPWVLALFGAVILADLRLGRDDRAARVFGQLQVLGLVIGWFFTTFTFRHMDVAGPWAWALVVGLWAVAVVLFHAWWLWTRRRVLATG
ncbi:hypothetical protein [Marinibacterium sp. SX1]|uniref:hypothetical protein n=1 Tax=Marinibacterium sp. SX1 TaxID=3388424 RepID=UPI003D1771AF